MNELVQASATFGVVISCLFYFAGTKIRQRFRVGLLNPLLIAVVLVIAFLRMLNIDYESYNSSAKYLSWLLTPATVSLAIPLYQQLDKLKKNYRAILISIFAGVMTSMASILAMAALFGLSHTEYVTLLPKSITTAIGMDLSAEMGGIQAITVAVIIVTGILGNVTSEYLLRWLRITDPVAKGLAIGTGSHAIGTARALEMGETEGAMSSLSIVIAGLMTVIAASVFSMFW